MLLATCCGTCPQAGCCSSGCWQSKAPHLAHGAVRLEEVGLEVCVEQAAGQALYGVIDGKHVNALAILDVRTLHTHMPRLIDASSVC